MKVVLVGSGNAASGLSVLIQKAGHEIVQVVSRNIEHARALASRYNTAAASYLAEIPSLLLPIFIL